MRQAATFNPTAIAPPDKPKGEKKVKRRVSLGIAVNAETGEVLEGGIETEEVSASGTPVGAGKRHSTRTHTVANTSATFTRARDELRKVRTAPCLAYLSDLTLIFAIHSKLLFQSVRRLKSKRLPKRS